MSKPAKRRRQRRRRSALKAGLPPGAAIYMGERRDEPVSVDLLAYRADHVDEQDNPAPEDYGPTLSTTHTSWLNVDGIHDAAEVARLGEAYSFHKLWVEDILNPGGRPKAEFLDGKAFVIAKMLTVKGCGASAEVELEQVSFVLGPDWLVTFQEREGDVFEPVRKRIKTGTGVITSRGTDYLLHALLDAIVDNYFVTVDALEARLDELEERAFSQIEDDAPQDVLLLKQQLSLMREAVWPMREMVSTLISSEGEVIKAATTPYFRDLYDHVVQVMDVVDSSRERLAGVLDLHLSLTSHQMNKTMRVLTVVATVFIPLTFIAGLYGMNFKNMPELEYRYGYHIVLAAMIALGGAMLLWFKKRRWM